MRIFYLLLFVLLCTCVRAQRNWQPAEVVLANGERRSGEIDDRGWDGEITRLEFRASETADITTYRPEALLSVSAGERRWISRDIEVDGAPGRNSDLALNVNYPPLSRRALLQVLRRGQVSLFVYQGPENRNHYFIQNAVDTGLIYLQYRPRLIRAGGADRLRAGGSFRSQLAAILLPGCPQIKGAIAQVDYTSFALTRLFDNYYSCTGQKADFRQQEEKTSIDVGPLVGIERGQLNSDFPRFRSRFDGVSFSSLSLGVDTRLVPPIMNERLSFFLSVAYERFDIQYDDTDSLNGFVEENRLTHQGVLATLGGGYRILQGPVTLGLRVGGQIAVHGNDFYERTNYVNGVITFEFPDEEYSQSNNTGVYLALTAELGNLMLQVSGRRNARISDQVEIYNTQHLGASLVYYLF